MESLQDIATYKGKQMNVSGSVTVVMAPQQGEATTNPKSTPTMPASMSKPASMRGMMVMTFTSTSTQT
nr:hypothetical protein [Haemophilus sp. C1]